MAESAGSSQHLRHGTYNDLASEYYDSDRHPTSANFREASQRLFEPWLRELVHPHFRILEVGAGRSLVSEWMMDNSLREVCLIATDLSPSMLDYSNLREPRLPLLAVCDAQALPFPENSFDLVASSLGDPYNTPQFWGEAKRVARRGGHIIFTTPSFQWAQRFRNGDKWAEFLVANGGAIAVTSHVEPEDRQRNMIKESGLTILADRNAHEEDLSITRLSPKLRTGPIVSGYLVQKSNQEE